MYLIADNGSDDVDALKLKEVLNKSRDFKSLYYMLADDIS